MKRKSNPIRKLYIYIYISVYSPFSDRNIISSCHGHLLCRSQVLRYPLIHSLTMPFLVVKLVFCLQLYTPYISSPSPRHFSSSHVHTISAYLSNGSCDRLNSNQLSPFFTCPVFHGNTTHPSNHLLFQTLTQNNISLKGHN